MAQRTLRQTWKNHSHQGIWCAHKLGSGWLVYEKGICRRRRAGGYGYPCPGYGEISAWRPETCFGLCKAWDLLQGFRCRRYRTHPRRMGEWGNLLHRVGLVAASQRWTRSCHTVVRHTGIWTVISNEIGAT